jgi:cytochrome c peroxidase
MTRFLCALCLFFLINSPVIGVAGTIESDLQRIIRSLDLRPLPTKPFEKTPKFKLGRALFFDPILSGSRDVACATCHLIHRGTSDAVQVSIGSGGEGLGEVRRLPSDRLQQQRNALDLWNRDNNSVKSMFWDGRVEVLDSQKRIFRSPLGELLPEGLENLMAVLAIFPLAREDEMLGIPSVRSSEKLPFPHGNQVNELAVNSMHLESNVRIAAVIRGVMFRLIGGDHKPSQPWHQPYRDLFMAAYPSVETNDLSISHLANSLSHFIEIAFATRNTPWDSYVSGNISSISDSAKQGAITFFGKGRCSICHSGPLFSDFSFHSLGVIDAEGAVGREVDFGRFKVTENTEDIYKFRTPPLRNVTLTAPYFHNGSAQTLDDAINQHIDPFYFADKYDANGSFAMELEQVEAISPILSVYRINLSGEDVSDLKAFLKSLEDDGMEHIEDIVPNSVPSGLIVPTIEPGR